MMISKLYSLHFETTKEYAQNLETLLELIAECEENSFVVAGEVCLTGYDYENFEAMVDFSEVALPKLLKSSQNKTVILTMLARDGGVVKNFAYVFHNGKLIRKQPKVRLFKFGEEHHYMESGVDEDVAIFEIDGVKVGILICFEIRFKDFWQKLEGADIIAIPSWWGALREQNYLSLTNALAIMNQCFVIASDNLNEECCKASGIVDPFGVEKRNKKQLLLSHPFDKKEIRKMRRYMDVGIECE